MENDGIQRLLKAEDEASSTIQRAREARTQRLRQAQSEAEKASQALKLKLESEFKSELSKLDTGDSSNAAKLKQETDAELKVIEETFANNQQAVIDMLLFQVTTVKLDVEEALKQSLITLKEQGQA